ncbi:hypothetical protein MTMBA_06360 [Moorella thermoacetica]
MKKFERHVLDFVEIFKGRYLKLLCDITGVANKNN